MNRINFPLKYTVHSFEGKNTGRFKKNNFDIWRITTGDGTAEFPKINIEGEKASASIGFNSGMGFEWYFAKNKGHWKLERVDISNY